MEVERERYITDVVDIRNNRAVLGQEHKVGPTERFEFGMPSDAMSAVIGGMYVSNWNADFVQSELGKDGEVARCYFDKKVAVDIGDPESTVSRRKRKLFFRNGFGYLCIPSGFTQDTKRLRRLYELSLEEYRDYESRHPRPEMLQEVTLVDSKGNVRRALVTAIDTKVGGGMTGSIEKQRQELKEASKLSKKELKAAKIRTRLHRRLRKCLQKGIPFRNPFVAPGKRLFNVKYASEEA